MAYDIFRRRQVSRDWSCGSNPGLGSRGPVWPWMLGTIAVVGWLSSISHKGHHEIEERLKREELVKQRAMVKMAGIRAR